MKRMKRCSKELLRVSYCASCCASWIVVLSSLAVADTPSVSYIFPAGGQRGATVKFTVGGHYLHEVCPFEMLGPGVQASAKIHRAKETVWFEGPVIPLPDSQQQEDYPKDQTGEVRIAADAPLGFRRWRVWTSQGATPSRKFIVGELPEVVEEEIDGLPIPTVVKLPVTINGRIFPREDIDIWTFQAEAGKSYTCEVMAARLGSPLDSRLEVLGPDGNRVAENTDGLGVDSRLRFVAATSGEYQVRIHDVNFAGLQHYVYRLTITDGAYIENVYPLGGRRGQTTAFHLFGQQTPSDPISISLPSDEREFHPLTIQAGGASSNSFLIELSDWTEHLETEPNNEPAQVQPVAWPAVLNGRIGAAGDVDAWRLEMKQDEQLVLDLRAARLGSLLDSVLTIRDAGGKTLAQSDDISNGQTDSKLTFKAPADGVYSAEVTDRLQNRGGSQFAYRLRVAPPENAEADLRLPLPVDAFTLNRGQTAKMKITANRIGGFDGEIDLRVEGLPDGVTVENNKIAAKQNDTQLTFHADEKTEIGATKIRITGQAKIVDRNVVRPAIQPADSWHDLEIDHVLLAVSLPTPFKVNGEFETKYAARGSTFYRHYTIARGGFDGPLEVRLADRQVRHLQGVTGPTITVPPGQSAFDYPIKLPPWMEIGRTSRTAVMAVGEVEEASGEKHQVSFTSHEQNEQIIVLVDPGQLDVQCQTKSLLAEPGQSAGVQVRVGRGGELQLPARVELVVPPHIRGISANILTLATNQDEGELTLRFAEHEIGPFNMPLKVRATVLHHGEPYTAEAELQVLRLP